jgi:hypothetical protein
VGACHRCGAPYRLYHYEDGKRVEKPPECSFQEWYIPFARRYWHAHHRNVDPGAYNFPGSSYEVAQHADFEAHRAWHEAHRPEIVAASPKAGAS